MKRPFFPGLYEKKEGTESLDPCSHLFLRDLESMAKNPIKQYMRGRLSIDLAKDVVGAEIKNKEFSLSYLDRSIFQKKLLTADFETLLLRSKAQGGFPLGVFEKIACRHLEDEKKELEEMLLILGIDKTDLFYIEMSEGVNKKVKKNENLWLCPPLMIQTKEEMISLTGTVGPICSQGLMVWSGLGLADLLKLWPTYLVFLLLQEREFERETKQEVLSLKEGKRKSRTVVDPSEALALYCQYYKKGLKTASPFHPEWASFLLQEDREAKIKGMTKSFQANGMWQKKDPYHQWLMKHAEPFCVEAIDVSWKKELNMAFSCFVKWAEGDKTYG